MIVASQPDDDRGPNQDVKIANNLVAKPDTLHDVRMSLPTRGYPI